ncbi:hypothetical protein [Micromonospora sp. DT233]|uniref:hypothetical protein n=1 Tax=Micromonospora sp. DT233 TaxID=3393432 RepID=UPI003CE9D84F
MENAEYLAGEAMLAQACRTNGTADLAGLDDRTVRAEVIEQLLLAPDAADLPVRGIRLANALVTGPLRLNGAQVNCPLVFDGCDFYELPEFRDAQLLSLAMPGCHVPGLDAEGLQVHGSLRLQGSTRLGRRFVSTGQLSLLGARIGGTLYLRDADLSTPDEPKDVYPLNASRLQVAHHFSCTSTRVDGQLRMINAKVGGVVNFRGTTIRRPGKLCLQAERLEVGESIWFGNKFTAEGRVLLNYARVGGTVDLAGARLLAPEQLTESEGPAAGTISLRALGIRIGRDLLVTKGFHAEGGLELTSAKVTGKLSFRGAEKCGSGERIELSGVSAGTMELLFTNRPSGELNLRNAHTELLVDDPRSWPEMIILDGFKYGRLQPESDVSIAQRLDMVRRGMQGYLPQPYEQLATVYRSAGQEQEARRVAMAKERARRSRLGLPGRAWGVVLQATVGYGYRTWLAGLWLLGLTVVGAVAFGHGQATPIVDRPPPFQDVVYTLDLLLPIADLGQEKAWQLGGALQWLTWTYVIAGWVLTTAVIAGLTRALNRS